MISVKDQSVFELEDFPTLSGLKLKQLLRHPYHRIWLENYLRLRLFLNQFGRFPLDREHHPKGFPVGHWSHVQRREFVIGRMPLWRYELLNAIGFIWSKKRESWHEVFDRADTLQKSKGSPLSKNGNVSDEERTLKNWIYTQRLRIKQGKLEKKKIRLLIKSGLIIDKTDFQWNVEYGKVKAFIKKNRRLPSAHSANEEERYLGKWRLYHVERDKKGLVPEWQAKKIAALGLDNKIYEITWNEKFEATRKIMKSVFQSGDLSSKGGLRHILGDDLFSWWQVQRRKYREGWLEEGKAKLLRENNLLYKFGDLLDRIKQSKGSKQ